MAQNPGDLPGFRASVVAHRFVRCSGSGRVSIHLLGVRVLPFSTESPGQSYAPRITQESCRPRVSNRIVVGT